jgi:alpha-ketoglutarate-dependent taurine dioxygenase
MPPAEGARLLDELTAFCTQPQHVYSHHWRDGDAVMWDNRCTLHRATTYDKAKYKRELHRTTRGKDARQRICDDAGGVTSEMLGVRTAKRR